jgi:hypothetical protein
MRRIPHARTRREAAEEQARFPRPPLKEEIMRIRALARGACTLLAVTSAAWMAAPAFAQSDDVQLTGGPRRCPNYPPPACVCPTPSAASSEGGTTTTETPAAAPELPALASGVQGGRGVAFGSYIDSALIRNQVRIRYDAAFDNNRPDRAEFFYAKCGCFRALGQRAPGPPLPETNVDYQDISTYIEYALAPRLSVFVEAPVRFLNPEQNANATDFADMNVGAKFAVVSTADQVLTFQLRTIIPTGDAGRGLGTDHVSLEPSILLWKQLSDRFYLESELRDWIPIGGTDFAGNVLRYGVGFSYFVIGEPQLPGRQVDAQLSVAPVVEFVGWTVLSGKEFAPDIGTKNAAGDTIINAKFGLRLGYGDNHSFAVSYGRALTGAVWYKDIVRVEYRFAF